MIHSRRYKFLSPLVLNPGYAAVFAHNDGDGVRLVEVPILGWVLAKVTYYVQDDEKAPFRKTGKDKRIEPCILNDGEVVCLYDYGVVANCVVGIKDRRGSIEDFVDQHKRIAAEQAGFRVDTPADYQALRFAWEEDFSC
jgi:hypothetical protein